MLNQFACLNCIDNKKTVSLFHFPKTLHESKKISSICEYLIKNQFFISIFYIDLQSKLIFYEENLLVNNHFNIVHI